MTAIHPRGPRRPAVALLAGAAILLGVWLGVWLARSRIGPAAVRGVEAAPAGPALADEASGRLALPDVPLLDQEGRRVRLAEIARGRVVAVSFIYTTCATICPPIGAGFARLQADLGARAGRDVQLLTVTLDPVADTPDRLAAWGRRFGAGPGWTLLGGDKDDVDAVLKALRVYTPAKESHTPIVLVGDADGGEWVRVHALSSPGRLLATVERFIAARAR